MALQRITFTPLLNITAVASHTVSTKTRWANAWSEQSKLHCERLTLAASPGISEAVLFWRIGDHLWPKGRGWQVSGELSLADRSYVRVHVLGTDGRANHTWYGMLHNSSLETDREHYRAYGMESLLDEPCYDSHYIESNSPMTGVVLRSELGFTFNTVGTRPERIRNRSVSKRSVNGVKCYVFCEEEAHTQYWSTRDAVEYILAIAAPKDANDNVIFNWAASGLANLPNFDKPVLPTHGRTYREILNSLISRFRLTSWTCNETTITIFTFADADITLTNQLNQTVGTIPKNDDQYEYDISVDQSGRANRVTEASHVCDVVRVVGERRKSVFSINAGNDKTLVKAWTDAQQTDYIAGASGEADYPVAAENKLREERDKEARTRESLAAVFSWFKVPDWWDQKVKNGENTSSPLPIAITDTGTQFWIAKPTLAFLPSLPLLTNYSYSGGVIANNAIARKEGNRGNKSGDPPYEERPILAVIRTLTAAQNDYGLDQWVEVDELSASADLEPMYGNYRDVSTGNTSDRRWDATVRAIRDHPVVQLRIRGEVQHAIAATEFTGRDDAVAGALDWNDLIVTVCCYDTRSVTVEYPAVPVPVGEHISRLILQAPNHELIYVVPNTVVGTDASRQLVRSTGGYVYDDRDEMKLIAQRAYEWHKTPRYTFGYSTGFVDGEIQIGHLVTQYIDATGTHSLNSVVTEITYEFPIAESVSPVRPNATYVTAFAELDPIKVI